jgi:hypothetical protein
MYKHSLLLAAAALSVLPVFGQAPPSSTQTLSNLPLSFEPNVGQTDGEVRFVARGKGMIVYFTDNEIVMALHRREKTADGSSKTNRAVIRMKLTNGRPPLQAQGLDPQEGVSNYYKGNDPKAWRTNVPHYGRVSLSGVYDGVDLVSYGNQQKLEYDFVVAPGADPKQVQLAFEGVDSMDVNADGDLVLHTPIGDVLQKRPAVYQNSAQGRVNVAANYMISPRHRVSFELAAYDRKKPLVIDPVVTYATYLSGSSLDYASAIAVDKYGAAYVTGWTNSIDFPHTTNTHIGSDDAFVIKIFPTATVAASSLIYATFVGGAFENDRANAIAVDPAGNAYITGTTDGPNFPTMNGFQTKFAQGALQSQGTDAFVAKLSATGTLVYGSYLGGSKEDKGFGIAVDAAGSAYVTGHTFSTDFQPTAASYQTALDGSATGKSDAFVAKILPSGNQLMYWTYLGGGDSDYGRAIAVDASGAAYVTGWTFSTDFPFVSGLNTSKAGTSSSDAFVAKLDASGHSLIYSTCIGGATGEDEAYGIAVDSTGAAYITGSTLSTDFPFTPGTYQTASKGDSEAFVTKLAPAGNSLVYSTYLGGSKNDFGYAIAVDSTGAAYVAGYTDSSDFPSTTNMSPTTAYAGGTDAFVANLNPAGNALIYSTFFGGSGVDKAQGIAVDAEGAAYVAGYTESTLTTTPGSYQPTFKGAAGDDNGFLLKISGSVTPIGAQIWQPGRAPYINLPYKSAPALTFVWTEVDAAISYYLDVTNCGGTTFYSGSFNVQTTTSGSVNVALGSVCASLTTYFNSVPVTYSYKYDVVEFPFSVGRP